MPAESVPPSLEPAPTPPSTLAWLRSRTDEQLAALLAARFDLLVPAPADLAVLARRLDALPAARRALGRVDAFALQVLHGLWAAGAAETTVSVRELTQLLGGPAGAAEVAAAVEALETAGLVRGGMLPAATVAALGPFPGGLGRPSPLPVAELTGALSAVSEQGRAVVQRLAAGPPVGSVAVSSPQAAVVAELVAAGLLVEAGGSAESRTVELPRQVALLLRGPQPFGPAVAQPPAPQLVSHAPTLIAATGGGQIASCHDRARTLLQLLGNDPVPALRSGGVGIVPLRRIAAEMGMTTVLAALYLELLVASGLVSAATDRVGAPMRWMPTQAADVFLAGEVAGGWALLADTWLDLRRRPALVGSRDARGSLRTALTPDLSWRAGPVERRTVLAELTAAAHGQGVRPASVVDRLAFARPLQDRPVLTEVIDEILSEATELGLVVQEAITPAGRALLADGMAAAAVAAGGMLPEIIDSILVQADMTIIAPGRLSRHLADTLADLAEVESAGAATVYRLSAESLRHGLDAGYTRDDIHAVFAEYATTPVPQSVSYLIDDVARRHGVLRGGAAGAYLHSDDPALVAQAVAAADAAGVLLRALAPTVAVTDVDEATLVDVLRGAGLAPAAETLDGAVVDLRPTPRRIRATPPSRPEVALPGPPAPEQIAALVTRLRAADGSVAGASADPP